VKVSVLIPTKNEERNLPGCLKSVDWSDDVHVYDSASTDRTSEIARAGNAKIWAAPSYEGSAMFGGNEAEHRKWALTNIPFKHDWVLHIDADERVTAGLVHAIQEAVQSPGANVAFLIQRRDFFLGRWLKHVQATPYYIRLFRPQTMSYQRLINPVSVPSGPVAKLTGYLDHFPFSSGLGHWFSRHNSYSTLEAEQIVANRRTSTRFSMRRALFSRDIIERRFHQKEMFYRMPARPLMKFLLLYVFKRGFLDGKAGFTYAVLQSIYEYMIILKSCEIRCANVEGSISNRSVEETLDIVSRLPRHVRR
jgi:hypothetical protein